MPFYTVMEENVNWRTYYDVEADSPEEALENYGDFDYEAGDDESTGGAQVMPVVYGATNWSKTLICRRGSFVDLSERERELIAAGLRELPATPEILELLAKLR